jgi:hypothetical protein
MGIISNILRSVIVVICALMVLTGLRQRHDNIIKIMKASDEKNKRKTCIQSPENKKANCE